MKYWNKDKEVRKQYWTRIHYEPFGKNNKYDINRWCRQQPSTGKYYVYFGTNNWWFERSEDAVLFALRWS